MSDIVVTEFMDDASLGSLVERYQVHFDPTLHASEQTLYNQLTDCRALIVRNRTQVNDALLANAPNLSVVGRLGVGLDNIDLPACERRGIAVRPATGANTDSVAEYVVTMALVLLRGAYASTAAVRSGEWPREKCAGREARSKLLGLVGFGAIGRAAAARAQALGLRVCAYDPNIDANDPCWPSTGVARAGRLDELLAQCDVVSLHVPLIESTRHLIDARALATMKRGSVLINTARGGIVSEAALSAALESGHLAGAAIDVFEHEPPGAHAALVDAPNVILTPHVAGVTVESNRRVGEMIARVVIDHLENLDNAN